MSLTCLQTPYYWPLVNHYWFGFWTAMLYVMLLFFTAVVTNQRLEVKFANVSCSNAGVTDLPG